MIYSRSAEYAIRALIPLARAPEGKFTMARTLAERENIPAHFLAKILQQLARKGLLRSSKGPQGGFLLKVPAGEIRLLDIVEALDGLETFHLPPGSPAEVPDGLYCTMHDEWVELKNEILDYLKSNTVADLARALEIKQRMLARRARRRAAARRN